LTSIWMTFSLKLPFACHCISQRLPFLHSQTFERVATITGAELCSPVIPPQLYLIVKATCQKDKWEPYTCHETSYKPISWCHTLRTEPKFDITVTSMIKNRGRMFLYKRWTHWLMNDWCGTGAKKEEHV
jgi:hypothetical protein